MYTEYEWIFIVFLGISALYDWKERKIPMHLFCIAAVLSFAMLVWKRDREFWDLFWGLEVGVGLLIVSKAVKGEIGTGDGLFFCISGLLLGLEKNLLLLGGGILVCGLYSIFLLLFGILADISVKKWRLPFLTFLFPIGIGIVFM